MNGNVTTPVVIQPVTSAPVVTSNTPNLKLGMTNIYVKMMRTKLRNLGYFKAYGTPGVPTSSVTETSYFGAETQVQLKKYQCDVLSICSGSPTTNGYGMVGPKTKAALGL